MYLTDNSSRNCKHVITALLFYRKGTLEAEASDIELKQFDATIDAFIQECSSALYSEETAEKKQQKAVEAVKKEIDDEIPF